MVVYNQRRTAEALAERNRQLADSEHAARLNAQDRQQEAESARQNEAEERKSADAVAQMMIKFLRRADPEVDGSQLTIAAALDRAFAELTADKQVKPRVRGGVLLNIGQTWAGLGRYLDALKAYQEATRLFEMEYGADDRDALLSQTKVAEAYYLLGDSHRAIDMYRRLLPRLNAVMGERHEVTLSAVDGLGSALTSVGRVAESVVLLEENLKSAQATLGTQDANSWMAMHSLGQAKVAAGQFDDAIYLLRSALSYRQASLPATHPSVLTTTRNLAMALQWSG
ncbi:MAG: tetratricopeptide repeat protein, partial [Planctomycetales bacterium]|nr:tetratricopeptide repeat protein [Planctomycetales bacterium]